MAPPPADIKTTNKFEALTDISSQEKPPSPTAYEVPFEELIQVPSKRQNRRMRDSIKLMSRQSMKCVSSCCASGIEAFPILNKEKRGGETPEFTPCRRIENDDIPENIPQALREAELNKIIAPANSRPKGAEGELADGRLQRGGDSRANGSEGELVIEPVDSRSKGPEGEPAKWPAETHGKQGRFPELDMTIALKEADKSTAGQILSGLKAYVNALEEKSNLDYWNAEEGQKALHVKMEERERDAKKERQQIDGRIRESLSPLDYTAESKASLSPVSPQKKSGSK